MTDKKLVSEDRRKLMKAAAAGAGAAALFGGLGVSPFMSAALAEAAGKSEKPLKAAFSNAGLQATWCAQGKQAAEYWGKLFNVDVTWFDGQLDAVKQRAAIDNMASQKWDFVAIQAFGIGTLTAPVNKMIDAGIPVIDMDTLIAPLDTINVLTLIAPEQHLHGRVGHPGARRRDQRRRQYHYNSRRARPHRRARPRQGLPLGCREIPEAQGPRRAAGRLGRHQGCANLGDAAHEISEDRRGLLPQ